MNPITKVMCSNNVKRKGKNIYAKILSWIPDSFINTLTVARSSTSSNQALRHFRLNMYIYTG